MPSWPGAVRPLPGAGSGARMRGRSGAVGVRFALGSHDAGGNRIHGWGTHMELEAFVHWLGMSPNEAIAAATSAGAELLGRTDLGTIAEGKSADFVVLDANPLEDIRNTPPGSPASFSGAPRWTGRQCGRGGHRSVPTRRPAARFGKVRIPVPAPVAGDPHTSRAETRCRKRGPPSHRLDPICTCSLAAARRRGRPSGGDWATPSTDVRYPSWR